MQDRLAVGTSRAKVACRNQYEFLAEAVDGSGSNHSLRASNSFRRKESAIAIEFLVHPDARGLAATLGWALAEQKGGDSIQRR